MNNNQPSFLRKVANFTKASIEHIAAGLPVVTPERFQERLNACARCPHLDPEKEVCTLCGCIIERKASWETSSCPDSPKRWK